MNSLTPEILQIKIRSKESLEGLNILINQLKNDNINIDISEIISKMSNVSNHLSDLAVGLSQSDQAYQMLPNFSFYPRSAEFLQHIQGLSVKPSREVEDEAIKLSENFDINNTLTQNELVDKLNNFNLQCNKITNSLRKMNKPVVLDTDKKLDIDPTLLEARNTLLLAMHRGHGLRTFGLVSKSK